MNTKKHYIALFFTAVILCPLFTLLYFPIKQKIVEQQALEKMEHASLEVIRIHRQDLVWVKKGKEIRFQNSLFDVKKLEIIGDSLQLSVLKDTKEMELHALKSKLDKAGNSEGLLIQKQAQQLVWANYLPDIDCHTTSIVLAKDRFGIYTSRLEKGALRFCFSPPWLG